MANEQLRFSKINVLCITVCCVVLHGILADSDDDIDCGTKNFTRPLIKRGDQSIRGEWPFIAAIYQTNYLKYLCGGTVISTKHVLTAAHCIQGKYSSVKLSPNDVIVRIGSYNLTIQREVGAIQRNVSGIFVHPEWEVYEDDYDADIAILVLSETVVFTNYIQPVCIPADDAIIMNSTGIVVGWGSAENDYHEEIPRQAVTKALHDLHCFRRDYVIIPISSHRTFCAGDGDGVPNSGDSGGGLFVFSGLAWVQYGIVSAIRTDRAGHVTADSLAIYTNVKIFKNWINDTVTKSGSALGVAMKILEKVNLKCKYEVQFRLGRYFSYACLVYDVDIRNKNTEVVSFTGHHIGRNSHSDVTMIEFINGTMIYLPNGMGKIFKNVRKLNSNFTLNTRRLKRSNFQDFISLTEFRVEWNEIKTIDEYSLWELSHLTIFVLRHNRLSTIKENTFERNYFLREVNLGSNKLEFLPENLFQYNPNLEEVDVSDNSLKLIDERIFVNNLKLREVWLNLNQLEFLPHNLFQNNLLLEIVSFEGNPLKVIYIDFSDFKNVSKIFFNYNRCIDANYVGTEVLEQYRNEIRNMTKFQAAINVNCNSLES